MAKMFYTLEEAQEKLGFSEAQIKQYVQEGVLREFRDGPKIMYKVDEVDNLAASGLSGSGSGELQLAPEDAGEALDLTSEDIFEDIPLASGEGEGEISLMPGDSADQISLDDTTSQVTAKDKDDTVITSHGTDALIDTDEALESIDPLEQAKIPADLEDQIDLDSGSSGSGLLDLSREADDTSLGAELLEEIYPDTTEGAIETQVPSSLEIPTEADSMVAAEAQAPPVAEYLRVVPLEDPTSGPFGAMMVIPMLMLIFLGFVTTTALAGIRPRLLDGISGYIWFVVGGAGVLAVLFVVAGLALVGKGSADGAEKEKKAKQEKAKKTKPQKEKKAKKKK